MVWLIKLLVWIGMLLSLWAEPEPTPPTPAPTATPTVTPVPTPTPLVSCDTTLVLSPELSLLEASEAAADGWNAWFGCQAIVIANGGPSVRWVGEDEWPGGAEAQAWRGGSVWVSTRFDYTYKSMTCALMHEFGHVLGYSHDYPLLMQPDYWASRTMFICAPDGS